MATGSAACRLPSSRSSPRFSNLHLISSSSRKLRQRYRPCSLSMNGCGSWMEMPPLGVCETRTLPAVSALESAISELQSAVLSLNANPPESSSGIIRLQVPIPQKANAIDWLHAQSQHLPRCFFSSRDQGIDSDLFSLNGVGFQCSSSPNLVGVAGVGSAVFFQRFDPFSLKDWRCIKRFLSEDCPLIRAYGAIRFDATRSISLEWKDFGSFYFIVPQVEFDELEESSMLATTIAWDETLHWTWENAIHGIQATMHEISPCFSRLRKEVLRTGVVSRTHVPAKASWDTSVNKALHTIKSLDSELIKVVLARCTTFVTDSCIDPVALLACLQVEGKNAYQFYIQPPDAPAFIGNTVSLVVLSGAFLGRTSLSMGIWLKPKCISCADDDNSLKNIRFKPEQLFHRKNLNISSEALAGTRARGLSRDEDEKIGQELLSSLKDGREFTIVRDSIRRKLENICKELVVEPSKALRKLPRIQHLSAQLSGRLGSEDDEFAILTSLHPSPAVCGLPTEEARQFIENNEMFDRGMFAGPVGWFGRRECEFAVGIRSALVGKGVSTLIYAGAGIVEGANASFEWEELDLKASQFTKLLQLWERQACHQGTNIGSVRRMG